MDNQMQRDLQIDPHDLSNEIVRQPGLYAYYCEKLADAERELKHVKLKATVYEAAADKMVRDKALAAREKITETIVEKRIRQLDQWVMHQRNVIDAHTVVDQLRAVVDSMRQKKDMLITYSANLRTERQSSFNMREGESQDRPIPMTNQHVAGNK